MRIGDAAAERLVALTSAGDAAAQNNLGVVFHRAGRAADAERAFDRAIALDGTMGVARRNLRAVPRDAADHTAASRHAQVRYDATDDDAWRALVRHYSARGEFDAASDVLTRWDAEATTVVAPSLERARWALEAGHPDEALAAIARARAGASAQVPTGDVALFAMLDLLEARAAYQCGDAARALSAVDRARAVTPDDAEAELLRSFVLGELGATHAAAASRARAADLDPAVGRVDAGVASVSSGAFDADERSRGDEVGPRHADPRQAPTASGTLAMVAALAHKGYFREALATLERSSRDESTDAAHLSAIGIVHLQRGAHRDAVTALVAALAAVRAGSPTASYAVRLAVAEFLVGDIEAADARARAVTHAAVAPRVLTAAITLRALAAWRRADVSAARAYLLDAAAHARGLDDTTRGAVAVNLALLLAELGAGAAAVAAGAAAARLSPASAAAHAAHGRALSQSGAPILARDAYARACALAPDDAAACYGLAFAAGAAGEWPASRTALARATALSPVVRSPVPCLLIDADGPIVLPSDGSAVRPTPSPTDAGDTTPPGAASAGRHAFEYAHVDARLSAGEYERALAGVEAALARGAPAADGLLRAGHALLRSGRVTDALDRYRRAGTAAPDDPVPELHALRAMYRLGRLADVSERARAAIERWPDDPAFAALLARADADRGEGAAAIAALDRCAHASRDAIVAGDAPAFWADVACAWQALGAWDAAADAWGEAAGAGPTVAGPALARARALARAGNPDAAESLLAGIAERAPELSDVWRARAEIALGAGQLSMARAHLARVIGRDAGDADALATFAVACIDAARVSEAHAAATQALAVDGEHPLALAVSGDCAAAAGDVVAARAAWARALAVSPVGAGATRARRGIRGQRANASVATVATVPV